MKPGTTRSTEEASDPAPRGSSVQTACLVIIAAAVGGTSLYVLRGILVPFVLAVFFTFCLTPVIDLQMRYLRVPRFIALIGSTLLGAVILLGVALIILASVQQLTANTEAYQQRLNELAEKVVARVPLEWMERLLPEDEDQPETPPAAETPPPQQLNINLQIDPATGRTEARDDADGAVDLEPGEAVNAPLQSLDTQTNETLSTEQRTRILLNRLFNESEQYIGTSLNALGNALLTVVSNGLLVLLFMFFIIAGKTTRIARSDSLLSEIEYGVKRYVLLKTVISVLTGIAQGLVLWFFGVEFALMFGFLGVILNFIPTIGPPIAVLITVPIILLNNELSPLAMGMVLLCQAVVHGLSGNLAEPRIMGRSFDLHPIVVMIMLIFFGMLWGIVGMFLATPIAAVMKVILQKSPSTQWLAELMAGRLDVLDHMNDPDSAPASAPPEA